MEQGDARVVHPDSMSDRGASSMDSGLAVDIRESSMDSGSAGDIRAASMNSVVIDVVKGESFRIAVDTFGLNVRN